MIPKKIKAEQEMIAQAVRNATTPDSLRLASNRILALVEDWEGTIVIKHHLHASPRRTVDQVFGMGADTKTHMKY